MVYKTIGLMSGSSLDGLDIIFTHIQETAGKWDFEIKKTACYPYDKSWIEKLTGAMHLSARDYCLLHSEYGHFLGKTVRRFMEEHHILLQADLITSHGHTIFHQPEKGMTAQLGDGAAIAAEMNMAVISDLRALDVAMGGQGAPIVPMGEKLLFHDYDFFLNIGGIANISFHGKNEIIAFDVCPANRILNSLASMLGKPYDDKGIWAQNGQLNTALLAQLNALEYYNQPWPKSLANEFGTDLILPMVHRHSLSIQGKLRTYTEHIADQVNRAITKLLDDQPKNETAHKLLISGGGAFNTFLISCLKEKLADLNITIVIPEADVIKFKEALIMALLGILRWRENSTTLASVSGARRNSIGGALWMGQEG